MFAVVINIFCFKAGPMSRLRIASKWFCRGVGVTFEWRSVACQLKCLSICHKHQNALYPISISEQSTEAGVQPAGMREKATILGSVHLNVSGAPCDNTITQSPGNARRHIRDIHVLQNLACCWIVD